MSLRHQSMYRYSLNHLNLGFVAEALSMARELMELSVQSSDAKNFYAAQRIMMLAGQSTLDSYPSSSTSQGESLTQKQIVDAFKALNGQRYTEARQTLELLCNDLWTSRSIDDYNSCAFPLLV
jgi:hypothetical protein